MPRKRLSSSSIPRLRHTGRGKYTDYQDGAIPGLTLRVYPSGARNWWHRHRGSTHRRKIGDYPEMGLEEAIAITAERLSHHAGSRAAPSSRTVGELLDHYIANYRTRRKRRRVTEHTGDKFYLSKFREALGTRRIDEVEPDDVRRYLSRWDSKPYAQNRALQRVRALYRWADEIDWFSGKMPTRGIQLNRERSRNRCVTEGEVERMIRGLWESESPQVSAAVELSSIYGWRIGEVLSLRWEDISAERITLRDGKNGDDHTVPVTARSLELLKGQRGLSGHTVWVFAGRSSHLGYRAAYDAWRRTMLRTGVRDVQLKDLRHYRTSALLEARVPRRTVASITGHKDLSVLDSNYHDVSMEETMCALECEKSPGGQLVSGWDNRSKSRQ